MYRLFAFPFLLLTLLFLSPFTCWTARADDDEANNTINLIWTLEAIDANDGVENDYFGFDVDVDGSLIVVGAPGKENNTGAVYVYRDLVQEAKLVVPMERWAKDAMDGTTFGGALAVSGDTIVAGVANENKVFVFAWNGTEYEQQSVETVTPIDIGSPPLEGDWFGYAVAVAQDRMVVSAPNAGNLTGSVFVFERNGSIWTETAYLQPVDSVFRSGFGLNVDMEGNRIIVGSPGVNDYAGAAYVYELSDDGSWGLLATITPSGTAELFGYATAISGDRVAISAPAMDDGPGGVYIYSLTDLSETVLQHSGQETEFRYGGYLDLFGDILVVNEDTNILVYEFNEGTWDLAETVASPHSDPSIATDGSTIVFGTLEYASNRGRAFVYSTVETPAASPTSDAEGDNGTKAEGDNGTKAEDGPTSSPPAVQSFASVPFSNLWNIMFLTMFMAHAAGQTF